MNKSIILALVLISNTSWAMASLDSPLGKWKTIDDVTKKPKSIVEITEKDGMLEGKILKLFREPTEEQNPKCDKCSGERKDKPIIGMNILWNLKKEGSKWSDGSILDPKNGSRYNSTIKVVDSGKKLDVRGYIGISLLGRTQTWERAE